MTLRPLDRAVRCCCRSGVKAGSPHNACMRAPRRRRPMRRSPGPVPPGIDLEVIVARVAYVGSGEHKTFPSFAGPPHPRADASKCDPRLADQDELTCWLQQAIREGRTGGQWDGDFPRYIWHRAEARSVTGGTRPWATTSIPSPLMARLRPAGVSSMTLRPLDRAVRCCCRSGVKARSPHNACMRAPRRRRPMRRSPGPVPPGIDLEVIVSRVTYVGSGEHKTFPSFAGPPHPRADASKCDPRLADQDELTCWLQQASREGRTGGQWDGDFPRYIWHTVGLRGFPTKPGS